MHTHIYMLYIHVGLHIRHIGKTGVLLRNAYIDCKSVWKGNKITNKFKIMVISGVVTRTGHSGEVKILLSDLCNSRLAVC